MNDPQDLLYTNSFISKNIITENELKQETDYYDRFKNYIDNGVVDETQKYIDDNLYENSPVNINQTLNRKWPVSNNKNHYPLFDTYISDVSTNQYKKQVITKINIDNKNRDISQYFNPNSFSLDLPKVFTNIKKYIINDINFSNINQSLTNANNCIAWQYASYNFLIENNIDINILPTPGKKILYSTLPNSVYINNNPEITTNEVMNYLTYQTSVTPGFYNIDDLISNIKIETSKIVHGYNTLPVIVGTIPVSPTSIVEQPYYTSKKRIGTPHLFSCFIDPQTSIVRFVNRMEELEIAAIQTFSPYENNFVENDVFYNFSSQLSNSTPYGLDTSLIYILLPKINDITDQFYYNVNCIYTQNSFPLVITNLKTSVGNIDPLLINYTEFYDLNIYLNNGYTESQTVSISHYKYIDTITISSNITTSSSLGTSTTTSNSKSYLRFGLLLSAGNLNGNNYNRNGGPILPSITENIILNTSLNNFLNNYNNVYSPLGSIINAPIQTGGSASTNNNTIYNSYNTSGILADYNYIPNQALIGRALLFRWIFDKNNNEYINYEIESLNEKKRSLLKILGWPIANQTAQIYTIINNSALGFGFVHTNYEAILVNESNLNNYNTYSFSNFPQTTLNLQYFSNNYYFVNSSYIYLKISFDSENNDNIQEYYNSLSSYQNQYNQVYINNFFFNVGIGEDYTNLSNCKILNIYKKDQSNIFTKIMLSTIPGNYGTTNSNIINNNSYYVNYDYESNDVSQITVEVYDPSMKLLSIMNNFSFTLEIHEIHHVLKETLVNSQTNNVTTTGNFI